MSKKNEDFKELVVVVDGIEDHMMEHCDMVEDLDDRVESLEAYGNVVVSQIDDHEGRFQYVAEMLDEHEQELAITDERISELEEKVEAFKVLINEFLNGKPLEGFTVIGKTGLIGDPQ